MNFSPQQVHFDVVLKERLLPKGDITARWIKSGKLKMSNHRQQNNCIQKCANLLELCNPVRSYQPGQRNGTCTPLQGAQLEKHLLRRTFGKVAVWPEAEKNSWGEGAETFLLLQERSRRPQLTPLDGLCCYCHSWWEMEVCWCGAGSADRTPGCTLTAENHPDNCSGNLNTAGWGFAIQKSGTSETGSCFFLLLFLSNKIPSCLAWETCNIAIPKAIKKSHKPDVLQHPPRWSYLKTELKHRLSEDYF